MNTFQDAHQNELHDLPFLRYGKTVVTLNTALKSFSKKMGLGFVTLVELSDFTTEADTRIFTDRRTENLEAMEPTPQWEPTFRTRCVTAIKEVAQDNTMFNLLIKLDAPNVLSKISETMSMGSRGDIQSNVFRFCHCTTQTVETGRRTATCLCAESLQFTVDIMYDGNLKINPNSEQTPTPPIRPHVLYVGDINAKPVYIEFLEYEKHVLFPFYLPPSPKPSSSVPSSSSDPHPPHQSSSSKRKRGNEDDPIGNVLKDLTDALGRSGPESNNFAQGALERARESPSNREIEELIKRLENKIKRDKIFNAEEQLSAYKTMLDKSKETMQAQDVCNFCEPEESPLACRIKYTSHEAMARTGKRLFRNLHLDETLEEKVSPEILRNSRLADIEITKRLTEYVKNKENIRNMSHKKTCAELKFWGLMKDLEKRVKQYTTSSEINSAEKELWILTEEAGGIITVANRDKFGEMRRIVEQALRDKRKELEQPGGGQENCFTKMEELERRVNNIQESDFLEESEADINSAEADINSAEEAFEASKCTPKQKYDFRILQRRVYERLKRKKEALLMNKLKKVLNMFGTKSLGSLSEEYQSILSTIHQSGLGENPALGAYVILVRQKLENWRRNSI